jgi:hypothetical protein
MSIKRTTALAALILSAGTGGATQIPSLPAPDQTASVLQEIAVTQAFEARVNDYVLLHRLLEGPLPPLTMTRDITTVQASMRRLALRIQRARANAVQGDLITPDVGRIFRRRIVASLPPEQWAAILADNAAEEEDVRIGPPPALCVSMEWPEQVLFGFVPPQLLARLPLLPPELQYRIIGNSLVLWDHHANLIVDFLPDAFTVTS